MSDAVGTVFVSHKTCDAAIGRIVADFLRNESGNRVNVFFSSDSRFLTPRSGRSLDDELTEAIGQSGALVLIYTGMTQQVDWAYCIYEAAYAKSRGIPVYIFQCRGEPPAPLRHLVRYSVSNEEDVIKFVKDFLISDDFFSSRRGKLTNFSSDDPSLQKKAKELSAYLVTEVSKLSEGAREWTPWAYARVRLEAADVARIIERGKGFEERSSCASEALAERAIVVDSKGVDQIFGIGVDDNDLVQTMLASWRESCAGESMVWYQSLVDQITASTNRSFYPLRYEPIREAMGGEWYLPVVTRTLAYPEGSIEYCVLFLNILPRSALVQDVMIKRDRMYSQTLDENVMSQSSVRDLFDEMVRENRHRLPVLDPRGKIVYMIHRSMITEFIARWASKGKSVEQLTFRDMLEYSGMEDMFRSTFVFVSPNTTVDEARRMLKSRQGARDVFVTQSGNSDEPILGMLTTTDVVENM